MGKSWGRKIDAPDWSALIELAFFTEKCRGIAAQDPEVDIGELLTDHGGNYACKPTKLNHQVGPALIEQLPESLSGRALRGGDAVA